MHDLGSMVARTFATQFPGGATRWIATEASLPEIGPWEHILQRPALWHFGFGGPDMERLVAGRERIYLDRFWNEFSRDPACWGKAKCSHYVELYAQSGAMHACFAPFAAFGQDATDNKDFVAQGKLTMSIHGRTAGSDNNARPGLSFLGKSRESASLIDGLAPDFLHQLAQ